MLVKDELNYIFLQIKENFLFAKERRKTMKTYVYTAAGGNPTALNLGDEITRNDYPKISSSLQRDCPEIEQVGFVEKKKGVFRLQMAGGEFCGNATRAFACFLSDLNPEEKEFKFEVSGFPNLVRAKVIAKKGKIYDCEAIFEGFDCFVEEVALGKGKAQVVDLGGIIHIIIDEDEQSFDEVNYERKTKEIRELLDIDCEAVGVLWVKRERGQIFMKPVVWVKEIDTCYYETSCGSGSIAVGLIETKGNGKISIIQPSGKPINVKFNKKTLSLSSEIERVDRKEE